MGEEKSGDDDGDPDELAEGKFEYVTTNERGFSQVNYVIPQTLMS